MLLTTVGFFALTAICIVVYLRRTHTAAPTPAAASGPGCPRCGTPVSTESKFCPGCGVPQQIYDVVRAAQVVGSGAEAGTVGAMRAIVRSDQCVGCGTCVGACPEPGALKLVGKISTVNRALCKGHGNCVDACPVGAIFLTAGAAVQRVEVPLVDADFQSNVPGLYLAGEVGGRGLIKNAINEGKIAVEAIARSLPPGAPRTESDPAILDVAVVGSGPAGLSAGLEAMRVGLSYVVLEQGSLADTVRKYPRHKILLAEPVKIPLYGDLWIADASKETLLHVWETIVANTGLRVESLCPVENVQREGSIFRLTARDRVFLARRVVLAMGRRGSPRRLGVPGEELDKVFYDIVEMGVFQGQKTLVIGGGDSAIESAIGLANQPDTEVTLCYRGSSFHRAKERSREKLSRMVVEGRIRLQLNSEVVAIRRREIDLMTDGRIQTLANDVAIVRIGGEPPTKFLERIGVRMVKKDLAIVETAEAAVA